RGTRSPPGDTLAGRVTDARRRCAAPSAPARAAGTARAAGGRGGPPRRPRGRDGLERLVDAELGRRDHGDRVYMLPWLRSPVHAGGPPRMTEIASTDAPIVRFVAPDGSAVGDVEVGLSDDERRELLRLMIRSRQLDRECWALQRQGELTVYPSFEGQEAAQVGSAFALGPNDFVFPSFRELAAAVVRGVDVVEYLQYHRGTWHGGPYDPTAWRFAPICVPVATQIVHAVGWAMGSKLDGSAACSLAYF